MSELTDIANQTGFPRDNIVNIADNQHNNIAVPFEDVVKEHLPAVGDRRDWIFDLLTLRVCTHIKANHFRRNQTEIIWIKLIRIDTGMNMYTSDRLSVYN